MQGSCDTLNKFAGFEILCVQQVVAASVQMSMTMSRGLNSSSATCTSAPDKLGNRVEVHPNAI